MSYDLEVWTSNAPDLPTALPDNSRWQPGNGVWIWPGRGWQIVAGPVHRVEFEDVPADVHATLAGVGHMVEFNLEPIDAPDSALRLLRRAANALAKAAHGAILDPQADTVSTPAGVRRYLKPRLGKRGDDLTLSWFSANDATRSREGLERIVACLERWLPEAMPVRYGGYEPPPFRYSETGRTHLIDFLVEEYLTPQNLGFAVWYPKRPVLSVTMFLKAGPSFSGWRCNYVSMTLEASVVAQPGWTTALRGLWLEMATTVGAFYADARTLRDRPRGAATVDEFIRGDRHPVCSSLWAGIPRTGGHAIAIGQPYLSLWPAFESLAKRATDLAFLSNEDWSATEDVLAGVGQVPEGLATQSPPYSESGLGPNEVRVYPPIWPFGPTHSTRR